MRLSDDELTALLAKHGECNGDYHKREIGRQPHCKYCGGEDWPCETMRLATEVRQRRDVDKLDAINDKHNLSQSFAHFHNNDTCPSCLAEYTKAGLLDLAIQYGYIDEALGYEEGGR